MAKLFIPLKPKNNLIVEEIVENSILDELFIERRFGRTPYYLLVDTKNQESKIIPNSNHHFGGTDSPFSIAKTNGADAVLAAHLGYGPYMGFKNNRIPVFKAFDNMSIRSLIKMYQSGELKEMDAPPKGTCCSGGTHKH